MDSETYRLAILASGNGSNAENIIAYFSDAADVTVVAVYTNNPAAGVIERCKKWNVPSRIIPPASVADGPSMLELFLQENITHIILAGYLKLIPAAVVRHYPDRIINIHHSLLPLYGGKGMYGEKVHRAVHAAGERTSGITIHEVNEDYDKGRVLLQKTVALTADDSPADIAAKIHVLEMQWFPRIIDSWLHRPHSVRAV